MQKSSSEMENEGQSVLMWMISALGPFYSLVIPASGFLVFVGACLVVGLSRRPSVIAAYLVFVPLPLLIGMFASLHGFIDAFRVVANAVAAAEPRHYAEGISTGLFSTFVGLLVMFPAYIVVAFGLLLRTIYAAPKQEVRR